MQNEKMTEKTEQPDVTCTRIITKNGTVIFINENGSVTVKDPQGVVAFDSSNPGQTPPPPTGH